MNTASLIIIGTAFVFSVVTVFRNPKEYMKGLFKLNTDARKTSPVYLLILLLVVIGLPLHYIFKLETEILEILVTAFLGIIMIWKAFEVFKAPKAYFLGLFKKTNDPQKTSQEPLGLLIFCLVVIISYLLK